MPRGHHRSCKLDCILEDKSIIPYKEFTFYNKRGEKFTYGSIIYYPIISREGKAYIRKNTIECFAFVRDGAGNSITPMVLTGNTLLNLNDIYKSYEETEEVINKWEGKVVESIKKATKS